MSFAIVKVPRRNPGSTNVQYRTADCTWSANPNEARWYMMRNLAEYNMQSVTLQLSVESNKKLTIKKMSCV